MRARVGLNFVHVQPHPLNYSAPTCVDYWRVVGVISNSVLEKRCRKNSIQGNTVVISMLNRLKGSIISLCTCSMYSGIAYTCMPSVSAGLFSLPIGVLRNVESKVPNHNSSLVVIRKEWKWYAKLYTWTINNYSSSQCIQNLVEHDIYLTKTYGKVSGYANELNYDVYMEFQWC